MKAKIILMSALSVAAFTFGGCDDDDEVVYNGTDKVALINIILAFI